LDRGFAPALQKVIDMRKPAAKRSRVIRVRVSEEEYEALMQKGEAAGSMSALLRDHLGKVAIRYRDDERQRLVMLNRLNAKLNQIAKWCNTYKGDADAGQVTGHLAAVRQGLQRLLQAWEVQKP
jgi:hypothetical protein